MVKVILVSLFLSLSVNAANILMVGDSHTAGPFGQYMRNELAKNHNVAVYGHSSSAAHHWMSVKTYEFTGGIFHGIGIEGKRYNNPYPIHWRKKAPTPKYKDFLNNMLKYSEWTQKVGVIKPNVAVIALGANDSKTISNSRGEIRELQYSQRQEAILRMLELVRENNLKCIWIGPPHSELKSIPQEETLDKYLIEAVSNQCDYFSSRHYKAKKWLPQCDGMHFSCNSTSRAIAKEWALEASEFINSILE